MLGACKKHPQAYFLYVEDCFLQSDNADARIFSKDKKTHEDSAPVLCVLLVEEICVCSGCIVQIARLCRFVAGCWLLVAGCWLLVAGCWLLVAGCWLLVAKNCVRHTAACQVLYFSFCTFFVRIFIIAIGAFVYHYFTV